MVKNNKKDEKQKKSEFKIFLKKRAPIYLGLIAIFLVFVVPELTKSNLQSSFPSDLSDEKKQALDILMNYKGPNAKGLSVVDAVSNKIKDEYPDEKIYDNKKTKIIWLIQNINSSNYQINLNFESYKGKILYDWHVNIENQEIKSNNSESKHIIDIVDFYD
jgi:hypothetical protein